MEWNNDGYKLENYGIPTITKDDNLKQSSFSVGNIHVGGSEYVISSRSRKKNVSPFGKNVKVIGKEGILAEETEKRGGSSLGSSWFFLVDDDEY